MISKLHHNHSPNSSKRLITRRIAPITSSFHSFPIQAPPSPAPPTPTATMPSEPPPPLSFHRPTASERISALTLIASSIAQQRQIFIHRLTLHPFLLIPYLLTVYLVSQQFYRGTQSLPTLLMVTCGFAIAALTMAKRMGERYLDEAGRVRSMGLTWWDQGSKRDGIVAKFGGNVVGVIVWDVVGRDEVRIVAWSVMMRYRRRGLGRDLLEKCVAECKGKHGGRVRIEFAKNHANSMRIFESMTFHKDDVKRDTKAEAMLKSVLGNDKYMIS